jgi:serine/threonine protein phosphatase 1
MPGRTIAIGDVHGCLRALASLLRAIEPRPEDVIVTLGDYVNLGPDAQGTIECLIALEKQCSVIPLLGDHDQMLLDALAGRPQAFSIWLRMGGTSTLLSYDASASPVTAAQMTRIRAEHVAFLNRCLPYHEIESHIFVHAKYRPDLPMDRQPGWLLRWEPLRHGIPERHVSSKRVIAGHSMQESGEILDKGHFVCIDTGCHTGGWLTGLDVHSGRVWQTNERGELRRSEIAPNSTVRND